MQNSEEISIYDRKWSSISLLYRVDQVRKNVIKAPTIKETFVLRRRSDYFYIDQPIGSNFIFLPDSIYRELWQILCLVMILYQNFIIIYLLTYTSTFAETHFYLLLICDILFCFEILLNFNTGYFSDGVLIKHRKSITLKYIKTYFFFDFLACFPFQLIVPNMKLLTFPSVNFTKNDLANLIWCFKILNNLKLQNIFNNFQCHFSSQLVHTMFHLIKFLLSAIFLVHWTSCLMFLVFYKDIQNTGMLWDFIFDRGQNIYLRYFYMIVVTMTSTGYGDLTPYSIHMKVLDCGIMCLSCWLFAFLLTNSKDILLKYNAQDIFFREILLRIKKYLKLKKINRNLNYRIINYLKHMKKKSRKFHMDEDKILNDLSIPLREEVFTVTRGKVLNKCPIFKNYSYDFLKILIRSLSHSVFAPGDLIIKEGDRTDSIFFITKGRIEIYHQHTKTVFKELESRKYFGEISFFLQKPRCSSARCLIFSELLYLTRASMMNILIKRPKDLEYHKIFVLQANLSISLLSVKCYLCHKIGHIAKDCKEFVILIDASKNIVESNNKKYNLYKRVKVTHRESEKRLTKFVSRFNSKCAERHKFDPFVKYRDNPSLKSKCKNFIKESKMTRYRSNINDGVFFSNESEEREVEGSSSLLPIENQYTQNFLQQRSIKTEWKVSKSEQNLKSEENYTFGNILKSTSNQISDDLFIRVNYD